VCTPKKYNDVHPCKVYFFFHILKAFENIKVFLWLLILWAVKIQQEGQNLNCFVSADVILKDEGGQQNA